MKLVKIIAMTFLGLAVLMCAGASADQPATRPADSPSYTSPQLRRAMRAIGVGNTAGIRPPDDQEWDDMMQFMKKYSPARYNVLNTVPIGRDSPIALEAVRRWRNYVFTSEHFPDADITRDLLHRFGLEDELFYLTLRARADEGSERFELRQLIRNKVDEIVQLEFTDRQARIDRLKKILADDQIKLRADQAAEDDIVDRRTDLIFKRMEKLNPNLAPPTSRPDDPSSVDNVPPSESHNALLNLSGQPDSSGK